MEIVRFKSLLDILVGKFKQNLYDKKGEIIDTKCYFDYPFVLHFVVPNWCGVEINVPTTGTPTQEIYRAEKLADLKSGETKNCDDCITLLLENLIASGFLSACSHKCTIRTTDMKHFFKPYIDKKFSYFIGYAPSSSSIKISEAMKDTRFMDFVIQETQFIDTRLLYLSVGEWYIHISDESCDFCYDLSDHILLFKKNGRLYTWDSTSDREPELLTEKKSKNDYLIERALDEMVRKGTNFLNIEDAFHIAGRDRKKFYRNKNVSVSQDAFVQIHKAFQYRLEKKYPGLYNGDNQLIQIGEKGHVISKKSYCSYKSMRKDRDDIQADSGLK